VSKATRSKTKRRERAAPPATYLVAAVLAAIAGFGTIYVSFGPGGNGGLSLSPSSSPSGEAGTPSPGEAGTPSPGAAGSGPLVGLNKGAMAAFVIRPKPQTLPDITIADAGGAAKPLSDFAGKVVLLNIWATWCHPCREEMSTLDRLQAELGGKDFEVVAVNIDKGGSEKAKTFLQETGVTKLALYTDPSSKLFATLKTVGMPTTLLLNREGEEIGRLVGPAVWDSPAAVALIKAAIERDAKSAKSQS
jgi:thiol-disulfide isomerase/thioredoxin